MTNTEPRRARSIRILERWARAARACSVAWGAWSTITFAYLAIESGTNQNTDSLPVYVAGAAVWVATTVALAWNVNGPVRAWIRQVLTILRWQVAAGALITFSIALSAREELFLPLGMVGAYFLLSGLALITLSIVANGLDSLYLELDREEEANSRRRDLDELLLAIAAASCRKRHWFSMKPGRRAR